MMTSGRLLKVIPPKPVKASVLAGVAACLVGGGGHRLYPLPLLPRGGHGDLGDLPGGQPGKAYHELSDSTNALMVSGLYQYTVRDLVRQVFPANTMSNERQRQVDQYVAEYEAAQTDNEYTGLLAGKNVILVQLEAIDTWMLQEAYMPNLSKLKAESISFTNHYTPAYITAGTFNTEFMTNTGLLPATGGIATSVYGNNSFPLLPGQPLRPAGVHRPLLPQQRRKHL